MSSVPAAFIDKVVGSVGVGGVVAVVFVATLVVLYHMAVMVPEGHVAVRTRFKRARDAMGPGIHFLVPFVDGVERYAWSWRQEDAEGETYTTGLRGTMVPTSVLDIDVPEHMATAKDRVLVAVNVQLCVRVRDARKALFATTDGNVPEWLIKRTNECIATYVRAHTAKKLQEDPQALRAALEPELIGDFADLGVELVALKVQDVLPDKAGRERDMRNAALIRQHNEEVEKAERENQAKRARLEADAQHKRAAIEAELDLKRRRAEAEAEMRLAEIRARSAAEVAEQEARMHVELERAKVETAVQQEALKREAAAVEAECAAQERRARAQAETQRALIESSMVGGQLSPYVAEMEQTKRVAAFAGGNQQMVPAGTFTFADIPKLFSGGN